MSSRNSRNNRRSSSHRQRQDEQKRRERQAERRQRKTKKQPFWVGLIEVIHAFFFGIVGYIRKAFKSVKNPKDRKNMAPIQKVGRFGVIGLIAVIIISILGFGGYGIYWLFTNENGQQVYLEEEEVGIIWDTEITSQDIMKTVKAKLEKDAGNKLQLEGNIRLEPIHTKKKDTIKVEALITKICKEIPYHVLAYELLVEGEIMGVTATKEELEEMLDELAEPFVEEGHEIVEVDFEENVEIKETFIASDKIIEAAEIKKKLDTSSNEEEVVEVESGDSLEAIASRAGMTLDELLEVNPSFTVDTPLQIGQKITITVDKPFLSVITKEKVVYTDVIEKETETRENANEYITYKKVIQQGKNGQEEIEAHIIRINGFETDKQIIDSKVIEEAIPEVIEIGISQVPPQ